MESSSGVLAPPDEFAGLATSARGPSARTRLGIGAAIVLFLVALVVAVVMSALNSGGANDRVPLGELGESGSGSSVADAAGGSDAASAVAQGGSAGVEPASEGARVFVHVLGAVATAGLYELSEGSRVVDVVAAAGGFAADADPGGVNLARLLTDGEQLYVPRVGEVPPPVPAGVGGPDAAGGSAGSAAGAGLVNLNAATSADLETLPRIGPSLAQRILDWREANGGFASVDDLRNITGIGDKTFEGLKELVTV